MKKKAVIFDLDGTLLNTIEDLTNCTNYMCRQHNYPEHTKDTIKTFVGNGMRKLIARAIPEGFENPAYEECYATYIKYYNVHCMDKTVPYSGIMELLKVLSDKGIKMGICTNKANEAVQLLREKFFDRYIAAAVGQTEHTNKKPAPDTLFLAAEELGISKEDILYVGDSEVDYETAKNAGVDCVLVSWGFRAKEVLAELGDIQIIDSPQEILDYI